MQVSEMIKGKYLVGHALKNDLSVLMLKHPRRMIRDTATYKPYMRPHGRKGGKFKPRALKDLVRQHFKQTIQTGEHDPAEDARCALFLYRLKLKEWEKDIKDSVLKGKTTPSAIGENINGNDTNDIDNDKDKTENENDDDEGNKNKSELKQKLKKRKESGNGMFAHEQIFQQQMTSGNGSISLGVSTSNSNSTSNSTSNSGSSNITSADSILNVEKNKKNASKKLKSVADVDAYMQMMKASVSGTSSKSK